MGFAKADHEEKRHIRVSQSFQVGDGLVSEFPIGVIGIVNIQALESRADDAVGIVQVRFLQVFMARRPTNGARPRALGIPQRLTPCVCRIRGNNESDIANSTWSLSTADGNAADLTIASTEPDHVRVAIRKVTTQAAWDIQLNRAALPIESDHHYMIVFRARARFPRYTCFGITEAQSPQDNLGKHRYVRLTSEWQTFQMVFGPIPTGGDARIHFDVGGNTAEVEIRDLALLTLAVALSDSHMNNSQTSHLCYFPFSSLTMKANGAYSPCCKYKHDITHNGKTLDAANHSLGEAWNSDSLKALRSEFLEGKKPAGCRICWQEEAAGVHNP